MAFIHKNINSGLLMLITFISVALVATTVYGVTAFDSMNSEYFYMQDELQNLQKQLDEERAMTASIQKTAELNQEREKAIATLLEQERQKAASAPDAKVVTIEPSSVPTANTGVYNAYRQPSSTARTYFGWTPRKTYVY